MIIIPAWRCDGIIGRSLTSLASQTGNLPSGMRIVVAVNDGLESSFAAAEAYRELLESKGFEFLVIRTPAGRNLAIRAAEAHYKQGPILYLDQDARLSPGALSAFYAVALQDSDPRFIALQLKFTKSPSPLVRIFLKAWLSMPYVVNSPVVSGAYGVTQSGRARWMTLPNGVPDDKFVRLQFLMRERLYLRSESYEVLSPDTYSELIRNRIRYNISNKIISEHYKNSSFEDAKRLEGAGKMLLQPVQFFTLLGTTLAVSAVSWRRRK